MEDEYYRAEEGVMPVKWTAPEAIQFSQFTTKSDVWSFGVLLWELFSRGMTPYYQFSNVETAERVVGGYRLGIPQGCTVEMGNLMQDCWLQDPSARPSFKV